MNPNVNESIPPFQLAESLPNAANPFPISGQIAKNTIAKGITAKKVTIGTNLTPEKKDTIGCNSILCNLLYRTAEIAPTTIPPNTDVCNDNIPSL